MEREGHRRRLAGALSERDISGIIVIVPTTDFVSSDETIPPHRGS